MHSPTWIPSAAVYLGSTLSRPPQRNSKNRIFIELAFIKVRGRNVSKCSSEALLRALFLMNSTTAPPSLLENALRLIGWALLIGGLCLSLFADSLTGMGSLALSLKEFGFPSGTLCVAGILSLALGSIRRGQLREITPASSPPRLLPSVKGASPENANLRALEDRLIAELDRRHQDLRSELHEVSALIEANLEAAPLESRELPMAAGAELISVQRRRPMLSTRDTAELEITVELEEQGPDESLLWSHDKDKLRTGELEERLYGEVLADKEGFLWEFPLKRQRDPRNEASKQEETDPSKDQLQMDDEPTIDRSNISWFDWDEDDLV
jgi:hypothetical protein